jgi:16S rRNA (guanine966-N2)-methyltransferase
VRVIAGEARGRPLRAAPATRPTADLVKGVIFSMLEALAYKRGFEPDEDGNMAVALAWPRVLDLFAGSGALGIEALSRGAQHATFVEADRDAARIISTNLRSTDLSERATLIHAPVMLGLARVSGPIDLVFADPPYADPTTLDLALQALGRSELVHGTSVIVLEQPRGADAPSEIGLLKLASTRTHGGTRVSLYATPEC